MTTIATTPVTTSYRVPVDLILPNPEQPRKHFDQAELEGLAESIREHDVIQPISVEQAEDGYYILHDGERRLRAAKLAGLTDIPAVILAPMNGGGTKKRLTRAIVANVQRADMNPIEEARAYARLRDEFGMTLSEISKSTGRSYATIGNLLLLLELEPSVQDLIAAGRLPKDSRLARVMKELSPEVQIKLAERFASMKMSVKGCLEAVRRTQSILGQRPESRPDFPAMHYAVSKTRPAIKTARWNVLKQLGMLPPWETVVEGAMSTCQACALYDMAGPSTCRECGLVDFLRRVMEQTQ